MIWFLFLFLAEADATSALTDLRARFASRPKEESLVALEQLARSAPNTDGGSQAAAWRGALAQQAGDPQAAQRWYAMAFAAPVGTTGHRLGARGLGDLDLRARRYRDARHHFELAAAGAEGILAQELSEKVQLSIKLERRHWLEILCWGLVAAALLYFAARAWRGEGPAGAPLELVYVIPVYLLLIVGALGHDPLVLEALILAAVGSLALIATAGWASRRKKPSARLRWAHAALLVAANLALFFAVVNQTGLLDSLVMTAQM
jgi:hypothetical protein